ncbi:MAG TPA: hypothetical protein VGR57_16625 [Ktedonobacterales bacterium]|nr:hypothetical protein [Ktedonobacterales bacterium]
MRLGVYLGEVTLPALAELVEGERVMLVEPNELQAEGIVRLLKLDGRRVWFAELLDPDAIEVIYPSQTEGLRHPAQA